MGIQLFTDSSSDLLTSERKEHNIRYYRMGMMIKGEERFCDIDYLDYTPEDLYRWIKEETQQIKTSQVSFKEYYDKTKEALDEGNDVLYIACTTRLSGSFNTFLMVKQELEPLYPNRRIEGFDSTKANYALGMQVLDAARNIEAGKSLDEVIEYFLANRQHYHQVGSLETLKYLKAAGRVSGASAFFADLISVKPIIMADIHGCNYVYTKVKGTKKSLIESFEYVKRNMVEGVTDVVYIGQAMAQEQQQYLKERIENELHVPVKEFWIGPVVGISCGPGMFGVYFKGNEITVDSDKK